MKPQDIEDLKQLIEFLKQYQVAEFDLDRGDLKIRLKFNPPEASSAGLGDLARVLASAPSAVARAAAAQTPERVDPGAGTESSDAGLDSGLHIVKSPLVGTFYGSPAPGSEPFVSPGDQVVKGQVIGIVEAMKLMNEIESDASGEIVKCIVSNGQPVEYGQPLYSIRVG
ncbi:MAG: acetyl-CoA carboxylase biotin carboxyl carrier protein [Terracidiphilus sp.]|jgi:acetyl-CoA carboxylase biotin carboxyl carrier protein